MVMIMACAAATAASVAQSDSVVLAVSSGETSLDLDINFGIRYVPPSRITVPVGELVRISAPNLGPLQWMKDGRAIAGATNATLILSRVQSTDAGTYAAEYTSPSMAGRGSQALQLSAGPTDRLVNMSSRVTLERGGIFIMGFVIAGAASPKKLIIRAVGPSLARFGVTDPLRQPALQIYDSTGQRYDNAYVYPPVVGGPTYESDLAASLVRCGAFPIDPGTDDVVVMKPFVPGSYSVHVSSRDGAGGTVLLEVYEVP